MIERFDNYDGNVYQSPNGTVSFRHAVSYYNWSNSQGLINMIRCGHDSVNWVGVGFLIESLNDYYQASYTDYCLGIYRQSTYGGGHAGFTEFIRLNGGFPVGTWTISSQGSGVGNNVYRDLGIDPETTYMRVSVKTTLAHVIPYKSSASAAQSGGVFHATTNF